MAPDTHNSNQVRTDPSERTVDQHTKEALLSADFHGLNAWCLGHMLDDPWFKDTVMSSTLNKLGDKTSGVELLRVFDKHAITFIYATITTSSKIHVLVGDAFVKFGTIENFKQLIKHQDGYPMFCQEVLLKSIEEMYQDAATHKIALGLPPKGLENLCIEHCEYHKHTDRNNPCWRNLKK